MNKFKEYTSYILIFLSIILFYIWMINYERNTNKILQEMDETYTEDILVVPEKSIDYWQDKGLEINWYTKGQKNEKNIKSNVNTNSNLRNNKNNNISNKIDSYDISVDIITTYIKEKEGFNSRAYRDGCLVKAKKCPTNKIRYSNGYGTLAKSKNEVITKKEAEIRLRKHIENTIYPKMKDVKFKTEQQIYASIDFAYNIGHNAFRNNIVDSNMEVDCARMTKYTVFNGKNNEGLQKRRFENFIQCVSINE